VNDAISEADWNTSRPKFDIEPERAETLKTIGRISAAGARTLVPFLGLATPSAPAGFAIGSAVGELSGQMIEVATGLRKAEDIDFKAALVEAGIGAGLGAVGGKLLRLARGTELAARAPRTVGALALGAEAAVTAPAAETVRRAALGQEPLTGAELAQTAATGAVLGGGLGALTSKAAGTIPKPFIGPPAPGTPTGAILFGPESKIVELGRQLARSREVPPGTIEQVSLPVMRELVDSFIANPALVGKLEQTDSFKRGERLFSQMMEVTRAEAPHLLDDVLEHHLNAIGSSIEEAMSRSGMMQQQLSRLRGAVDKLAGASAATAIQSGGRTAYKALLELNNFSRALAVTQLSTQVRNNIVNTGRLGMHLVSKTIEDFASGEMPGKRALPFIKAAIRPLRTLNEVKTILGSQPELRDKLLQQYTGGVSSGRVEQQWSKRLVEIANWANLGLGKRVERVFNAIGFRGTLEELLNQEIGKGNLQGTVGDFIHNPTTIPFWIEKAATGVALDLTFAAQPKSALMNSALKVFHDVPLLTMIVPYPRFMANALEFVGEHNPAGYLSLLGRDAAGNFLASDPTKVASALSKAAVGTVMLSAAIALRNSSLGGAHWFQVNSTDAEGKPATFDMRAYSPLLTGPLFIAEIIKRFSERGELGRMDPADINEGLFGMRKMADLGLVAADLATGRLSPDGLPERLVAAIGEYLARFTVPFRTIKDTIGGAQHELGFEPTEAELRDLREHPLVGPAAANVPFATSTLPNFPKRAKLFAEGTRGQTGGFQKQVMGVSPQERLLVEQTLAELDINPYEVGPKARAQTPEGRIESRAIEAEMGPLVGRLLPQYILSPFFQNKNAAERHELLLARIGQLRSIATAHARQKLRQEQPGVLPRVEADRSVAGEGIGAIRRQALLRARLNE
jgi:hypothetical protein